MLSNPVILQKTVLMHCCVLTHTQCDLVWTFDYQDRRQSALCQYIRVKTHCDNVVRHITYFINLYFTTEKRKLKTDNQCDDSVG